jgi:uncharacterized protein (DUF1810 family)
VTSVSSGNLGRFLEAQAPVFEAVRAELKAGAKRSHWMWFVFPQLRGLGRTSTAQFYGIESAAEALAYWHHPVLGPRLKSCIELVLAAPRERTAHDVFGSPDDLKFRSCLTLFQHVAPEEPPFGAALLRFYGGQPDVRTLELLAGPRLPGQGNLRT